MPDLGKAGRSRGKAINFGAARIKVNGRQLGDPQSFAKVEVGAPFHFGNAHRVLLDNAAVLVLPIGMLCGKFVEMQTKLLTRLAPVD